MFGLGIGEIVVILFVALIFIGPKKLPELAKGLGKGIREFQNAANGLKEIVKNPPASNEQHQTENKIAEHTGDKGDAGPLDQPEVETPSLKEETPTKSET